MSPRILTALTALVATTAITQASPDRLVHVQVSFKRTIVEHDKTSFAHACGGTAETQLELIESGTFGSHQYPMSDDTDQIIVQWPLDQLPPGAKPLTGKASYDFTTSGKSHDCKDSGKFSGTAHADANLADMYFQLAFSQNTSQGTLALTPGFGEGTATGSGTEVSSNQTVTMSYAPIAKSGARLLVSGLGNVNLNTAAQWTSYGAAGAQLRKGAEQAAQDGDLTVAKTGSGFNISYHASHSFPDPQSTSGGGDKHESTRTVTTDITVSIGGPPLDIDAILEPLPGPIPGLAIASYDKFVPIGPKPGPDEKLDAVAFRVYLVKKTKPSERVGDVPFQVTYLLDSSHERGDSINSPIDGKADNDLAWHPMVAKIGNVASQTDTTLASTPDHGGDVMAIVQSHDFGAYGALHAKVHLKTGEDIEAHLAGKTATDVKIPKDDDGNHIADAWDQRLSDKGATSDKEHVDGNHFDGDGLTLYEEYRGALCNGKHIRLDPKKKDLFIINKVTGKNAANVEAGAKRLETAAAGSVAVHVCKPGELSEQTKIVNANSGFAKGGDQHAILIHEGTVGKGAVAETNPDGPSQSDGSSAAREALHENFAISPGHVIDLVIDPKAVFNDANYAYAVAHELGHGVGIHHHGAHLSESTDIYVPRIKSATAYLVDVNGKPIALPPISPDDLVARDGSMASGDLSCIMAYNNNYAYAYTGHHLPEFPLLVAELKAKNAYPSDPQGKLVVVHIGDRPDGTTLCRSKAGTDINAAKPGVRPSVFGDATTDGCWGQLHVKDW